MTASAVISEVRQLYRGPSNWPFVHLLVLGVNWPISDVLLVAKRSVRLRIRTFRFALPFTPFAAHRERPGSSQFVFGAGSIWLAYMLRPKCLGKLLTTTAQPVDPLSRHRGKVGRVGKGFFA